MGLTDLPENIRIRCCTMSNIGSHQKHFLSLEDIDDDDNTFISVMRLNTNYRHLLTGTWTTTSWRICQKTYL